MPIYRRPKKLALDEFDSVVEPENIEASYHRIAVYFTEHHTLSFATPEGSAGVLNELIHQHGEPVRLALHDQLCESGNSLRQLVGDAHAPGGIPFALAKLLPLLETRYHLAPAVALRVAVLLIEAVAAHGETAVCEALVWQHRKAAREVRHSVKKKADAMARSASRRKRAQPKVKPGGSSTTRRPKPAVPGTAAGPKKVN